MTISQEDRDEIARADALFDAQQEYAYEEERELWRYCVEIIGSRLVLRLQGRVENPWQRAGLIASRLVDAIDRVPNLQVLIRKVQPDLMAYRESRMTPADRYRW